MAYLCDICGFSCCYRRQALQKDGERERELGYPCCVVPVLELEGMDFIFLSRVLTRKGRTGTLYRIFSENEEEPVSTVFTFCVFVCSCFCVFFFRSSSPSSSFYFPFYLQRSIYMKMSTHVLVVLWLQSVLCSGPFLLLDKKNSE